MTELRGKREGCAGRSEGRRGAVGEQRKGPHSESCTEMTATGRAVAAPLPPDEV